MIYQLVTRPHFYTATTYFQTWGRQLASQHNLMFYEGLPKTKCLPQATFIFSDVERLTPSEAEIAAQVWAQLAASQHQLQLLNHPTRSMRRYELLRTLYEHGINSFNIYRLTELRKPQSFPVFLRGENDHDGTLTSLLYSFEELQSAIDMLDRQGKSKEDKVIIEYCDTSDKHGVFRKYAAFIVGDHIIPTHIFFSQKWMTKVAVTEKDVSEMMLREEQEFVETNPHADALRQIARIAHIDYGRIDYGVLNGNVQVWEINTNPWLPRLNYGEAKRKGIVEYSTQRLNAAFEAINSHLPANLEVTNPVYRPVLKRAARLGFDAVPDSVKMYLRRKLRNSHQLGARLQQWSE
jgi:hypothetical protein